MKSLPTGTVTFLFTDIEGSTALLQRLGDRRYAEVLEEHRRLLRRAFADGHGEEVGTQGDAFLVAFSRAREAVGAAVAAQLALTKHAWPDGASLRVRMGLHTGEPISGNSDYVGLDVHRAARICAAGHGGQILLSDAVSVLAARDLPPGISLRDLGPHRLKDLKEPERLRQVVHPDIQTDFPPLKALDARPNNLPIQLTSFVGREKEIAEVRRLLATARLVTLTGSGGAGKTRLALQVTTDVLQDYPDGVWLAELAPIADEALVPKIVASAMSVPEQPGRDIINTLIDTLRTKTPLLVLDNCEHLLAACRDLTATVLRTCPRVRILATSREGLGVPGETLWRVPPLSMPEDLRHLAPPEELVLYDAVRLFADRAMAVQPGFTITSDNAPAVAQVCQRLDGIPLAIELAAARVKVLAVGQIATRLDDRFRLLTGGSRAVLPRHQTLGAAIDWSYNQLSEMERVLLRRLSVFAGGWTLEAVEAICTSGSAEVASTLDLLTSLVDKSLVLADTPHGEARYRLLETVRQYARERLLEAGEEADVQNRHRDWYLALAENAKAETWRGLHGETWLSRLANEHDNLRAALEWSEEKQGGEEALLRLAGTLDYFWFRDGHWDEAQRWLDRALARSAGAPSAVLPAALIGAARFAYYRGDYDLATNLGERGLALGREVEDKDHCWEALVYLSAIARARGDFDKSRRMLDESLRLSRERTNDWCQGITLTELGATVRSQGELKLAETYGSQGLDLLTTVGEVWGIALARTQLGFTTLSLGEYDRAVESFTEGLVLCRDLWVRGYCVEGLAQVASSLRKYDRAARLFGVADRLREQLGFRQTPQNRVQHDEISVHTRGSLGDVMFSAMWAEGRAMTLEQAIEYALTTETE